MRANGSPCAQLKCEQRLQARRLCRGFSNATLLALLGIFALVTLLAQIQRGAIDLGALIPAKAPAAEKTKSTAAKAAKKPGKPPPMLPPVKHPLSGAAKQYVAQRAKDVARQDSIRWKTWQAVGHMDASRAVAMLAAMDQTAAVALLSQLKSRDLARILDAAEPAQASAWATALLAQPALPEVPDPFKAEAKRAGLYDDTQALLEQYAAGNAADAQSGAGGTGGAATEPGAGAAEATGGAGAATSPGADTAPPAADAVNTSPASYITDTGFHTFQPVQVGISAADGAAAQRGRPGPLQLSVIA